MNELNLVGLHEDGESLVLVCAGQRYTLRIDDALRAAVRRDRPQLERVQDAGSMSVREIQARIRAGASAQEVAEASGIPLERVRRYEGPVLAEREHVVSRARASVVGPDGSPPLDELVADRLAARGVVPEGVEWDSAREASGEWRVLARFDAGGSRRTATWRYDAGARTVAALDDEARWLSETEVGRGDVLPRVAGPGRDTEVLRAVLSPVDARDASPDAATTDALLDDLGRRRGQRRDAEHAHAGHGHAGHPGAERAEDDTPDRSPWGPRQDASRHPSRSRPAMSVDLPHLDRVRHTSDDGDADDVGHAEVVALPVRARNDEAHEPDRDASADREPGPGAEVRAAERHGLDLHGPAAADGTTGTHPDAQRPAGHEHTLHDRQRRTARKTRTKIPSWDEIMFGSRPEQ